MTASSRSRFLRQGLVALAGLSLAAGRAQGLNPCLETGLSSLYAQTSPAVVSVVSHRSQFLHDEKADGQRRRVTSYRRLVATGIVIDAAGCLVTTDRVAQPGDSVIAYLSDGRALGTEYIGGNAAIHITLLQLKGPQPFPALHGGTDSGTGALPAWVAAVAYGAWQGPSPGRPSLVLSHRDAIETTQMPCGDSLETIWRIRAPFHPGNSGGALVTLEGQWIGLVTGALVSPERDQVVPVGGAGSWMYEAGLVVPAPLVVKAVREIRSCGAPAPSLGFLGVSTYRPGRTQADSLHREVGVVVSDVLLGSPAHHAGIMTGDVILRYQDQPVSDVTQLTRAVAESAPGVVVTMDILRDGVPRQFRVRIGDRTSEELAISRQTRVNAERSVLLREIERSEARIAALRKELRQLETRQSSSTGRTAPPRGRASD